MDDLNKYTEEDILQAVALHLMTLTKTEAFVQLNEKTKNEPHLQYYLEKLRGLFDVMQDDYQKVVETKNENNENLKFVMGNDGLTEV